jgi:hypothetical protein
LKNLGTKSNSQDNSQIQDKEKTPAAEVIDPLVFFSSLVGSSLSGEILGYEMNRLNEVFDGHADIQSHIRNVNKLSKAKQNSYRMFILFVLGFKKKSGSYPNSPDWSEIIGQRFNDEAMKNSKDIIDSFLEDGKPVWVWLSGFCNQWIAKTPVEDRRSFEVDQEERRKAYVMHLIGRASDLIRKDVGKDEMVSALTLFRETGDVSRLRQVVEAFEVKASA